ncbi:MAG: DNA polymerase IV [Deltaproteobacteria bacterium]|jgi:DNA polymerase-4|nr:DNA polymerase IV [Deltaproteobacteria bacterium]
MDAFYPAVEVLDNPELRGKPVIVGGSRERGVVSSASYEARAFGVHSAQPTATAARLCPNAIFLRGRMHRYREVSKQIFEIFLRFTPLVEPLSIDEAFLDVTGSERLLGDPVQIAKTIKATVLDETGLTVSAGVAPSKFVAKIASDMDKPDGLTVVEPHKVRVFLDPLPMKKMWGVGKVTQKALARLNIHTFKDLRLFRPDFLERKFGKNGPRMHLLAMGMDERNVETEHEIKSVGHERTFMHDIMDSGDAKKALLGLATQVARRMRRKKMTGKTVSLKVKYYDFKQITRAKTLAEFTDDGLEIYGAACDLLQKTQVGKRPVRLLGISLSQLSFVHAVGQLSLFGDDQSSQKRKELNMALDSIAEKHGDKSVRPATLFPDK